VTQCPFCHGNDTHIVILTPEGPDQMCPNKAVEQDPQ